MATLFSTAGNVIKDLNNTNPGSDSERGMDLDLQTVDQLGELSRMCEAELSCKEPCLGSLCYSIECQRTCADILVA